MREFAATEGIPVVGFAKGERKIEVMFVRIASNHDTPVKIITCVLPYQRRLDDLAL